VGERSRVAAVPRGSGVLLLTAAAGFFWLTAAAPTNSPRAAGPAIAVGINQESDVGADFNGDGFDDLAVGVPSEDLEGSDTVEDAGAVHVIYGSRVGLHGSKPIDDQLWHQGKFEFSEPRIAPRTGESFGQSLAAGDFDGDGFDDLAVGVPREDGGVVHYLRGSRAGLQATPFVLSQNFSGIAGDAEPGDRFGYSLAVGDFGKGSQDDLAIGVPGETLGSGRDAIVDAGAVNVVYGSASGLTAVGNWLWHQDSTAIPNPAEPGDQFGRALEAADLGRSAEADLVVGVEREEVGGSVGAGAVNVIYGSPQGLLGTGAQFWHQNRPDVPGVAEREDNFGSGLAAANFGKGEQADLAVGVPNEDAGRRNTGAVDVLYGSASGLSPTGAQLWYEGTRGIVEKPERNDHFGVALAAADLGLGPPADLAIGSEEGEERRFLPDRPGTGGLHMIHGSSAGLRVSGNYFLWQNSSGFDGAIEGRNQNLGDDLFGAALAAGDFGRGAGADLAVGVPGNNKGALGLPFKSAVGAVIVLFGDVRGLRGSDDQFWRQGEDALRGKAEEYDYFGEVLGD
jgi:hypothetical protein